LQKANVLSLWPEQLQSRVNPFSVDQPQAGINFSGSIQDSPVLLDFFQGPVNAKRRAIGTM